MYNIAVSQSQRENFENSRRKETYMIEGRRELNDIYRVWKKTSVTQEFHIRQIYPSKMKINTFPDKQKLSKLINSRPIIYHKKYKRKSLQTERDPS